MQAYESVPATFKAYFEAGPDGPSAPPAAVSYKVMVEMPLQGALLIMAPHACSLPAWHAALCYTSMRILGCNATR